MVTITQWTVVRLEFIAPERHITKTKCMQSSSTSPDIHYLLFLLLFGDRSDNILLVHRNATHHEVHRGKRLGNTAVRQTKGTLLQHSLGLDRSLRCQPEELQHVNEGVCHPVSKPIELKSLREGIPAWHKRKHPRLASLGSAIVIIGHIAGVEDLESGFLESIQTNAGVTDVWQTITFLNLLLDSSVVLVLGIVRIRHAPFVAGKYRSGLEDAVNFGIHSNSVGGVARCLDGIRGVIAGILEWHLHKVTLHRPALLGAQLRVSLAQLIAPIDLILVQSEAGNVGPGEFANIAHRSSDATSDIQNFEVGCRRGEAKLAGQIVLMAADRLTKVLVRVPIGKVERLAPSPLVKERGEVIV